MRDRRDMIKNFLETPAHLNFANEKLFKVLVADQQGFTADEARRFVQDFLIPAIDADRDEYVAANKTVKKRPPGAPNIDKDDNFWKQEVEAGVKVASLKPTKNTRDQLTTYMTDVLGRI